MSDRFEKPRLNSNQRLKLKKLYRRDNYHGCIAVGLNVAWVAVAVALPVWCGYWFYFLSILIVGSRQRALASLLHEAAHGTLFRSKVLNTTVGRVLCGWTILQSFDSYRTSHVLKHHPKIGQLEHDPDFQYMTQCGVYEPQSRLRFFARYLLGPMLGCLTPRYILFLLKDRLWFALARRGERIEVFMVIALHMAVLAGCCYSGFVLELLLFWWLPILVVYPVIGWFSELSEHYPLMEGDKGAVFYSRNRYAGVLERIFIGMHGDSYHLTHHLLPGVPHWNLRRATEILREDPVFRSWDQTWGGIFSSRGRGRVSFIQYVLNDLEFRRYVFSHTLAHRAGC